MYDQKSWVQCIGPWIQDEDGYLGGSSKILPSSDPTELADGQARGLPIGFVLDLLEILCIFSGRHDIEWELEHDYSDGILGYIRLGRAEDAVATTFKGLATLGEGMSGEMFPDEFDFFEM